VADDPPPTTTAHDPSTCPACRLFDSLPAGANARHGTRDERRLVAAILDAQDRAADRVTSFAGSLRFVYLHAVWFGIWVVVNIGLAGVGLEFDRYPFGLLTMIVSLEAIFLSTFVMVSQNRQAARADLRSQLDFENNLRAEIWSVHIGQALGITPDHVEHVVQREIAESRSELGDVAGT
jgi:uncharacterized membrane protein